MNREPLCRLYAHPIEQNSCKREAASDDEIERTKSFLNPNALTLGFARRFAAYKRPDLLLTDEDRLLRILTNKDRPVQLILPAKHILPMLRGML